MSLRFPSSAGDLYNLGAPALGIQTAISDPAHMRLVWGFLLPRIRTYHGILYVGIKSRSGSAHLALEKIPVCLLKPVASEIQGKMSGP